MNDELKDRAISLLKDAYAIGYEDGVQATNVDCGVVWEERIDAIKAEIKDCINACDELMSGKYPLIESEESLNNRKLSYKQCLCIIDKHIGGDEV